jgi:hypothetical protein
MIATGMTKIILLAFGNQIGPNWISYVHYGKAPH